MAIFYPSSLPFYSDKESQNVIEELSKKLGKKLTIHSNFTDFFRTLVLDLSLKEAELAKKYKISGYENFGKWQDLEEESALFKIPEEQRASQENLLKKIFNCLYAHEPASLQGTSITVIDESNFQISYEPLKALPSRFLALLPKNISHASLKPLIATVSIEIGNKSFSLTQYFTWAIESFEWLNKESLERASLEHPLKNSSVFFIPRKSLFVKSLQEEISVLFEKALCWDSKSSLDSLKDTMSLFYYLFSHNMKEKTGNSHQVHWLERAVYHFLKLEVSGGEGIDFCIVAITTPIFLEFKNVYKKAVSLKIK